MKEIKMNADGKDLTKRIFSAMLATAVTASVLANSVPPVLAATDERPVRTLTLDTRSYTMAPGNIYDFRAKVDGEGLRQEDVRVSSSRDGIARVARVSGTDKYRITGLREGVCYVIAEINGVHASIKVTVQKGVQKGGVAARSVSIIGYDTDPSAITLDTKSYQFSGTGKAYQFLAKGIAKGSSPTATSSNPGVASVSLKNANDSRGYLYEIRSVSAGSATITVSLGGVSAQLPVTVAGGTSSPITLDTKSYQFSGTGAVYQFLAKGIAKGSSPTATSSNPGVVSVSLKNANDPRGYLYEIRSVSAGSATITVSLGGSSAQMPVTVSSSDPVGSTAKTTDDVNLRSGPGTQYDKLALLYTGTTVSVLDTSSSEWTKVKTSGGVVGYVCTEYLQFSDGSQTAAVRLSHSSGTVPAGKTFYITATTQPSGGDVVWKSSNSSVATVSNGFIYGAAPGSATITATDASGKNSASCSVTVTKAEPVKAAYTTPNIAGIGQNVTLVAVTDNTRAGVRFVINMNDGTTKAFDVGSYASENVPAAEGLAGNNTRVWKTNVSFTKTGTYSVTAYSKTGASASWSSTGVKTSSFIVSSQDKNASTTESRRISDEMLSLIGQWEGYRAAVYPDTLAHNIPTIGYGQTMSDGAVFYNNLTKTQAWALLLNSVNDSYTGPVNSFISGNHLRVNQHQFDAMISFSYNIGTGYWNGSSQFDIRTIMLNSVVPPTVSSGQSLPATASLNFDLYASPSASAAKLTEVSVDASLQVLQTTFDSQTGSCWYQVRTASGVTGWGRAGYIQFQNSSSMVRDLNYMDSVAIGSEWLRWNRAGGNVYAGLVYRRLGEAKVLTFGNYAEASPSSALYKHNAYGFIYPDNAKQYEQ
jgi:GH24 family phage-related lysozyme (muramidase)/uncharacterized protein YjdB